jgi:hypothetical protein
MMKRIIAFYLSLILVFAAGAYAEDTAEYRDEIFAFRYPASWSCDTSPNGDIVLGSPDGSSAALAFAMISDLPNFTGDAETDAPGIQSYIAQYDGKNLALTGDYEMLRVGEMNGFRATGSWRATGQNAAMIVLTGSSHVVGFALVGGKALALEQAFLDSLELLGETPAESAEGFLRWEGTEFSEKHPEGGLFSLDYPAHYSSLAQTTGIVFMNPNDTSNIIMARAYTLDTDYSDALAPIIAANALPKSTKVEPNAKMVKIGGRNAAIIQGTVSGGPMAFYVIGSGRTALALMFTGEEACGMAEHVIQSTEIK